MQGLIIDMKIIVIISEWCVKGEGNQSLVGHGGYTHWGKKFTIDGLQAQTCLPTG